MKKLALFSIPTLIVLSFLLGCTLSLEEWVLPEEEKGFDEPVTIENDLGTFTYQYNEGVSPITQNVQEYVVSVIQDTIIYFMDTTPKQWLPKPGGYVSAGCSHKFPFGLNHKVLSVDKADGMYQVVVTKATHDEVFKELKFELSVDYTVPERPIYDSLELAQQGISLDDLADIDFSLLDSAYGKPVENSPRLVKVRDFRKLGSLRKIATREGDEEDENKDKIIDKSTPKDTTIKWSFGVEVSIEDIYKLVDKPVPSALKGAKVTGNFEKTDVTHQTIYIYEDKKLDYRKEYTIDRDSYTSFSLTLGFKSEKFTYDPTKEGKPLDLSPEERAKKFKDAWKQGNVFKQLTKDLSFEEIKKALAKAGSADGRKAFFKERKGIPKIYFPLPVPFDVAVVIDFTLQGSVVPACYGSATLTFYNGESVSGYVYNKGDKRDLTKEEIKEILPNPKKARSEVSSMALEGQVTASLKLGVGIGVEFAHSVGSKIDFNITAGFDIKIGVDFLADVHFVSEDRNYAQLFCDFNVDFVVYLSPAGIKIAEGKTNIYNKSLFNKKWYLTPVLDRKKSSCVKQNNLTKFDLDITATFGWKSLGLLRFLYPPERSSPFLRVYVDKYQGTSSVDIFPNMVESETGYTNYNYEGKVSEKDKYICNFSIADLPKKSSKYVGVPGWLDRRDGSINLFNDQKIDISIPDPIMTYVKGTTDYLATEAADMFDDEAFNEQFYTEGYRRNVKDYCYFQFGALFNFKETALLTEWGIEVELYAYNNMGEIQLLKQTTIPGEDLTNKTIINSGTKWIAVDFILNSRQLAHPINGFTPMARMRVVGKTIFNDTKRSSWTEGEFAGSKWNGRLLTLPHEYAKSHDRYENWTLSM